MLVADPVLEARLAALEDRTLVLQDLPMTALMRKLESDWQPDATTLLQGGSASITLLRDVAVGVGSLPWPGVAAAASTVLTVLHGLEGTPRIVICQAFTPVANAATRGIIIEPDDTTFTTTQFQCRGIFANGVTSTAAWPFCWVAIR